MMLVSLCISRKRGRLGDSIRLMCGLDYLKHVYALSDNEVCARWVENPYYHYLFDNVYFEHQFPINPASITRFRQRLGEDGAKKLPQLTVDSGVKTKTVKPSSFKQVVVDNTVIAKAVAFPTDAKLLNRYREHLPSLKVAGFVLMISMAVLTWCQTTGIEWYDIVPEKPTQNRLVESVNGSFRGAYLNEILFSSLPQARHEISKWKNDCNKQRPHASLGNTTPNTFVTNMTLHKLFGTVWH